MYLNGWNVHVQTDVFYHYRQHAVYKGVAPYGEGSGDIVLDNVVCTGDESSLAVCRHHGFMLENCAHSEDVGVICCMYLSMRTIHV